MVDISPEETHKPLVTTDNDGSTTMRGRRFDFATPLVTTMSSS